MRRVSCSMTVYPAGAGNTVTIHTMNCLRPVYPRWRGEHLPRASLRRFAIGLSPLARGTHGFGTVNFAYVWFIPAGAGEHLSTGVSKKARGRFIPAGAGNTIALSLSPSFSTVYPRWRGEHINVAVGLNFQRGLSPLARGTHQSAQLF